MNLKTILQLSSLVLILSLTGSCQNRDQSRSDPLAEAYERIDRGEYDSAIEYLRRLYQENQHPYVAMALASAYVGRAGLRIEHFWEFVKQMRGEEINLETVDDHPFYLQNKDRLKILARILPEDINTDLDNFTRAVAAMQAYRERLLTLPYVEFSKRADIEEAVIVLTDVNNKGARVYRAILNGVLLRSELDEGFSFWNNLDDRVAEVSERPLEIVNLFCSPVSGDMFAWLLTQFSRTEMIAGDLKHAFPSDSEQFSVFELGISELTEEIPRLQQTLVPRGCP